jgi:type IV pilus assembly protein PilM
MAKNQIVWGIDIGNTSLKALRCRVAEEPGKVEALACDFIEHSKVLSQPGTDVAEVMAETLQTFLNRNVIKGDRIAISVAGQNTISRFLPLPPVDPKKIPDVIRYEAKQWLPFDLNDVVFDFQPLGKPIQDAEDRNLVDATVGMFAIKRDVATKALAPYLNQSVDVDSIQSSPIALYNFVAFDQLPPPSAEAAETDTNAPPESLISLCIGTDATDVVITNGETIWIRNIPLGGNSFTRALTRELQLTFSKAEYLKRNIAISKDVDEQKRVITAMRPVFNDMVNEVNRSLEYYQTLNRKAKFQKIIALGNAAKLPGLRQYIAQNLGYEVVRPKGFNNLIGAEVVESPLFRDNLYSFAVCYGLAVQQLGISSLKTNLIPREVIMDRIIREKKPWMLAAAAALLLGITIQFAGVSSAYNSVMTDAYKRADERAKSALSLSSRYKSETSSAVSDFNRVDKIGSDLTSNVEGRIIWLELLRAVNAALPQSQPGAGLPPVGQQRPPMTSDSFAKVDRVFIESIEAITVDSLTEWFAPLKEENRYYPDDEELENLSVGGGNMTGGSAVGSVASSSTGDADTENGEGGEGETAPRTPTRMRESERFALVTGPTGTGTAKVVQITGHHYHNPRNPDEFVEDGGEAYLRKGFLRLLKFAEVDLPPTLEEQRTGTPTKPVKMSELGISYPTLLYVPNVVEQRIINPDLQPLPPDIVIDQRFQAELTQGQQGGTFQPSTRPSMATRPGAAGQAQQPQQRLLSEYARQRGVREPILTVRRFDFVIQFAWEETPPSQRQSTEETETDAAGLTN